MAVPPLTGARLRGTARSISIVASFAAIWGVNGSVAIPGPARIVTTLLVLLITVIWFGVAFTFHRASHHLPSTPNPTPTLFWTRAFWLAVLAECIAIPLVARLLSVTGHPDAIMPAVAIIVGLHFFGLIRVLQSWLFAMVGSAMVLLAVISLTLPPSVILAPSGERLAVRAAVVGFGCAVSLWGGILPLVVATRRHLLHAAT
jgi:hypothetical protein